MYMTMHASLRLCKVLRLFNHLKIGTVELVYSGHPSDAAKWLLYTGGLLIEVFNVYVVHGKFRWDFQY